MLHQENIANTWREQALLAKSMREEKEFK